MSISWPVKQNHGQNTKNMYKNNNNNNNKNRSFYNCKKNYKDSETIAKVLN